MRVYLSHAWRNHSSTLSTGPSFGANHARDILLTVAFVLYRRTLLLRRSSLQSSRLTLFSSCAPPCTRFPDDITAHWPADRERVLLGTIVLECIHEHNDELQRQIVFDPLPRVRGIEPSADPLLELRSAVYRLSGARRHVARLGEDDVSCKSGGRG